MVDTTKTCGGCGQTKPVDQFSRRGDGFQARCKACNRLSNKLRNRGQRCSYPERKRRNAIRGSEWTQVGARGRKRWDEDGSGCWVWLLSTQSSGYGSVYFEGRTSTAHRAAWIANNGPIPEEMHLHHRCGNRLCVNPAHLELLTAEEHAALHAEAAPPS